MNEPEYTIIIPAFQAATTIGECINALNAQTVPRERYEVIVVDDGSTDETANAAREAGADQVITCQHGGPSVARNTGATGALPP